MKHSVLLATLILALTACSSVGSLRNAAPTATYASSESAADVVSCVSDAWSRGKLQVGATGTVNGTSIELQQTDDGPVLALVDIKASGERTIAIYYSNLPYDDSWYFQQIKQCML